MDLSVQVLDVALKYSMLWKFLFFFLNFILFLNFT